MFQLMQIIKTKIKKELKHITLFNYTMCFENTLIHLGALYLINIFHLSTVCKSYYGEWFCDKIVSKNIKSVHKDLIRVKF